MTVDVEKLRYPVGKFSAPLEYSQEDMEKWMRDIENFPSLCKTELKDFTEEMLNESYRPGGWTARQVVHHVADSHMNGYIRFKLAMTEDVPAIKPYIESLWAELPDVKNAPPEISLNLLDALHKKWSLFLRSLKDSDFDRSYFHPESKKEFQLRTAIALYAWHGRHHLGHIHIVRSKFPSQGEKSNQS